MKKLILFLAVSFVARAASPALDAVEILGKELGPAFERVLGNGAANATVKKAILEAAQESPATREALHSLFLTSGKELKEVDATSADMIFRKELSKMVDSAGVVTGLKTALLLAEKSPMACRACGKVAVTIGSERVEVAVASHIEFRKAVRSLQDAANSPNLEKEGLRKYFNTLKDADPAIHDEAKRIFASSSFGQDEIARLVTLQEMYAVRSNAPGLTKSRKAFVEELIKLSSNKEGTINLPGKLVNSSVLDPVAMMSTPMGESGIQGWTAILAEVSKEGGTKAEMKTRLQRKIGELIRTAPADSKKELEAAFGEFNGNKCFGIF